MEADEPCRFSPPVPGECDITLSYGVIIPTVSHVGADNPPLKYESSSRLQQFPSSSTVNKDSNQKGWGLYMDSELKLGYFCSDKPPQYKNT